MRANLILKNLDKDNHGAYGALLFDPRWRKKRALILERDKHKCLNCGSRESLQVHHRQYHYKLRTQTYKAPWDYPNKLLISLCEECHKRGHQLYKVPTLVI